MLTYVCTTSTSLKLHLDRELAVKAVEEVKRDNICIARLPKPFLNSSPVQQIAKILLSSDDSFLHAIRDVINDYNAQLRVRCYVKEWVLLIRKLHSLAFLGTYTTHITGKVKSTEVLKDYLDLARLHWKWDYLEKTSPPRTISLLTKTLQKILKEAGVNVAASPTPKKKGLFEYLDPRKLLKITTQAIIMELDPLRKGKVLKALSEVSENVLQTNMMIEYTKSIVNIIEAGVDDSLERRLYKAVDISISEHERKSL